MTTQIESPYADTLTERHLIDHSGLDWPSETETG